MKLAIISVTAFQQNCSLATCPATNHAAFVDPGDKVDRPFEVLDIRGAALEKVLVTHGHIYRCGAVTEVASRAGVPIEGPNPDESFWIDQLDSQGRMFGLRGERRFTPDRWLHGGYEVTVGEMRFEVRQCTGHTPGHVIFANTTFGGDVLFKGSIGRTDFPRQTTQQPLRRRRGAGAGAA